MSGKCIDITGQTFGELTVLKRAGSDSYRKAKWLCKCSCGNDVIVNGAHLRSGHTKSCGCQKGGQNLVNLLGKKFGKLTVIEDTKKSDSSKSRLWKCLCDCGNETIVSSGKLKSGNTISCGCLTMSKGEFKIKQILDSHKIKYKQEYVVSEIGYKRFDFAILNDKEEVIKLIEYDGVQHFQEWAFSNETLADRQARDKIKNEWAAAHNIPLLRIPYWDYDKINFDMLQSK